MCRHLNNGTVLVKVPVLIIVKFRMYSTTSVNRPPWDTGSGFRGGETQTPLKKNELNIVGDNGGSRMCIYLQCGFYTKTLYKPSVFVFSMPTSNY